MKRVVSGRIAPLLVAFVLIQTASALIQASNAAAGYMPPAFPQFCKSYPGGCQRVGPVIREIALTAEREQQMRSVNSDVNRTIRQVADRGADVWSLPRKGEGDCEDIALLKREKLIALGWPTSVLLMTVARDRQGYGHAVLTVVTDRGDFILDNKTTQIRLPAATGYQYYSRQSAFSPHAWVNIAFDARKLSTASIGPNNLVTDDDRMLDGLRHFASLGAATFIKAKAWLVAPSVALVVEARNTQPRFTTAERRAMLLS
jgi:predicted transglutaminase-like cysteine proteinase